MPPVESQVPERATVEYITRNFANLQGLRMLPLAAVFAMWGASEAQLLTGALWWSLMGASIVGAVVGIVLIGRWYAHRFGTVEPRRHAGHTIRMALIVASIVALGIVVLMLGASGRIPQVERVALSAIVLGSALAVFGVVQGPVGRKVHSWTLRYGLVVAILGAVPIGMILEGGTHLLNASGVMSFVVAGFVLVSSIDTHRALTRLLPGDQGER